MNGRKIGKRIGRKWRMGFTLIELMVVVAIIGLLASIMMPSLSKAREAAKGASCMSNMRNLGTMLIVYTADNSRMFPTAYSYINGATGGLMNVNGVQVGGYNHWTAAIEASEYAKDVFSRKYPQVNNLFVCPSHAPGGWAPTNFTSQTDPARPNLPPRIANPPSGQFSQDASGPNGSGAYDDQQAPRLSYIANEVILPRKKFSLAYDSAHPAGPNTASLRQVSADEIDGAGNTILLGEFSESSNGIWGSSVGGGAAYKSHRPTNGIKSSQANSVFDGESYTPGMTVAKLTVAEAEAAIAAVKADKAVAPSSHHISYINEAAHGISGSNYTFADGHAAKATLKATLDPGNFMWGRKVYSCVDKPEIQDNP